MLWYDISVSNHGYIHIVYIEIELFRSTHKKQLAMFCRENIVSGLGKVWLEKKKAVSTCLNFSSWMLTLFFYYFFWKI